MTTTPSRFRKKPVAVEAIQLAVEPAYDDEVGRAAAQAYHDEIAEWINAGGGDANAGVNYVEIDTLEGVMTASPEDWIIRGVAGEYYPCKPDIFEATYEPADQTRPTDDQSGSRAHVQERITTAAELDALPVGSILRNGRGVAFELADEDHGRLLRGTNGVCIRDLVTFVYSWPLTVVYRPDRDLIAEAEAEALLDAAQAAEDSDPFEHPFRGLDEMTAWLRDRAEQAGADRG